MDLVYRFKDAETLASAAGGVQPAELSGASASRAMSLSAFRVELADAARFCAMRDAWSNLAQRAAEPNAFMEPAVVAAAVAHGPEPIRVALVWRHDAARSERLVGAWAFAIGRPSSTLLPIRLLKAPVHPFAFLSTPVVDASCTEDVLASILDAIEADPHLPKIIALTAMGDGGPVMTALRRVLEAHGRDHFVLNEGQRPRLESPLDGKSYLEQSLSSSSRKKLRQHRRRLAGDGSLMVAIHEGAATRPALEDFLALEASGWKGRQRTAILCNPRLAAFTRAAIHGLADAGRARIDALTRDGQPVSMQIILRSGRAAFTWKTAFDERFQDCSPGMLLLEDCTVSMLADSSIAFADSCAANADGYMSAWTQRQPVLDLWIDTRRGRSPAFNALVAVHKLSLAARGIAKRGYHQALALKKRQFPAPPKT